MKKKCRLYKPSSMQYGGQSNDKFTMTQDSQTDPIPQERANEFLLWLRKTTQEKKLTEELEAMDALNNNFAKRSNTIQQNAIEDFQIGGSIPALGAQTNNFNTHLAYGGNLTEDTNKENIKPYDDPSFWQGINTYDDMIAKFDGWAKLGIVKDKELYDAATKYTGLVWEQNPTSTTGTDWIPVQSTNNIKPQKPKFENENPQFRENPETGKLEQRRVRPSTGEEYWVASNPTMAGQYYKNAINQGNPNIKLSGREGVMRDMQLNPENITTDYNKPIPQITEAPASEEGIISNLAYGGNLDYMQKRDSNLQFFQDAYNQSNPNIMKNLQSFTGTMPKAQKGLSYPGNMQLLPEIDELTREDVLRMMEENDPKVMDPTQYQNESIQEFEPGSTEDPFNKNKRTNDRGNYGSTGMDPRNTNMAQGMIAGMRVGEGIFNYKNRAEEEQELRKRFSNVFETHGIAGQDRGDYMVNVPGIGDPLKPDQHTRMGYNTKIAQDGLEVDQELELTDEQINELITQGYNIEYLD